MDRYFGFDLGDAESAVSRLDAEDQTVPEELTLAGTKSFVTACAVTAEGGLLIGEQACYAAAVNRRALAPAAGKRRGHGGGGARRAAAHGLRGRGAGLGAPRRG